MSHHVSWQDQPWSVWDLRKRGRSSTDRIPQESVEINNSPWKIPNIKEASGQEEPMHPDWFYLFIKTLSKDTVACLYGGTRSISSRRTLPGLFLWVGCLIPQVFCIRALITSQEVMGQPHQPFSCSNKDKPVRKQHLFLPLFPLGQHPCVLNLLNFDLLDGSW